MNKGVVSATPLFYKQKEAPRHSDEVLPINQFSLNSFKIKQALRNT